MPRPNVTVRHVDAATLVDEGQRFDSIVMLNVLEHIADDVAVLQTLGKLLEPEGRIILYVPALNGLYGPWDRKVGHYRRYAPWRLRAVLAAAGLVEVDVRYMNLLSVPAWWAFSRTKAERGVGGSLALWDRTGIRLGRRFESVVRVPVGLTSSASLAWTADQRSARAVSPRWPVAISAAWMSSVNTKIEKPATIRNSPVTARWLVTDNSAGPCRSGSSARRAGRPGRAPTTNDAERTNAVPCTGTTA